MQVRDGIFERCELMCVVVLCERVESIAEAKFVA